MDDIWRVIARVSYTQWQSASTHRLHSDNQLKRKLKQLLQEAHQREDQTGIDRSIHSEEMTALEDVFHRASTADRPFEIPSCLVCPLTMEIYRDPVTTPSGFSYEAASLNEHLEKVGRFEPITRQPVQKSEIVRNLNLRSAVNQFLKEHPWAWKESL